MMHIRYFDRLTQIMQTEAVYGGFFLRFLYQNALGRILLPLVAKNALFSRFYGWLQKRPQSKIKIRPFIEKFQVDSSEFAQNISDYTSFNDFFTRKLKAGARPLSEGAVLPADGRYLVFPDLSLADGIWVKGKFFNLRELLQNQALAEKYSDGCLVIARLCPVDYHRFHFPFACKAGTPHLINGPLYSVSPIALKRNINILHENKRVITELKSDEFGAVQCIEVGATNVGSIVQTYTENSMVEKGAEKGYFEFGGSCMLLLFEKGRIQFADDLLKYSAEKIEVRGFMGQKMGCKTALHPI
ncbi:MAG: phosphatidylserine decarboxylase [Chlamydiales bacterium]|nr:phosphatidylserine decarboxylase [Chlamydiales bacterium]